MKKKNETLKVVTELIEADRDAQPHQEHAEVSELIAILKD